ncbi:MAG: hypothetical protein H7A01_08555 [Hahellaceae bacterium]|nr:hypothetical protein [Hahellaceae bacterium]MCP5211479.1 hypothetical protein [Hahellaceae bacterium]
MMPARFIHKFKRAWGLKNAPKRLAAVIMATGLMSAPAWAITDIDAVVWDSLEFTGSKLLIKLTSTVERERLPLDQAALELISPEGTHPKQPNGDYVNKTTITSSILTNKAVFTLWLNPDLEALQRTALYSGLKDWYRNYRFLDEGAFAQKIKPASGENKKPWQKWSNIDQGIHEYLPAESGKSLSESGAIFEAMAQGKIKRAGDVFSFNVFARDGSLQVTLKAVGTDTISVDYEHTLDGKTSRVRETANVLKVSVDARMLSKDSKSEDFSFMGYKDSIILHYDPEFNLPLRLSGDADVVGHVEIELTKAHFIDKRKYFKSAPTANTVMDTMAPVVETTAE